VLGDRLLQAAVIVARHLDHLEAAPAQQIERRAQVGVALPAPLIDQDQRCPPGHLICLPR
jgi:hypothetical protein